MKLLSRLSLIILATIALSWFLPWLFDYVFPVSDRQPFVQYSPVTDKWVISQFYKEGADPDIFDLDADGNIANHYTVEQRDSILPQTYYSRLMSRGVMPDSIAGREINMPTLRHNESVLMLSPRNFVMVQPKLWLMMESMPPRFNFEDPKEAFRLTDDNRVEFITIETNTINQQRSKRFTDAFSRNGFKFPARWLNANITSRKSYDNGYLLVDNEGTIFHLKQQAGRPYMTRIPMVDDETARYAFVMENMNHEELGLIVTDSGHLYRLLADYTLRLVPEVTFDVTCQRLIVMANYFNRVYRVTTDNEMKWYAVDSQTDALLDVYNYTIPTSQQATIAGWILPFRLTLTSDYDSLAYPRIIALSAGALLLGALLAVVIAVVYRRRRMSTAETATASLLTLLLGLYIFIPLLLIRK